MNKDPTNNNARIIVSIAAGLKIIVCQKRVSDNEKWDTNSAGGKALRFTKIRVAMF